MALRDLPVEVSSVPVPWALSFLLVGSVREKCLDGSNIIGVGQALSL